ncbi:MAG: hypothetical protein A3J24_02295 [Deltaproteobacteria bacterium RIFCSPLOWO2_02_FULL_53_8]|nr:MAG: hypothetical protein A3J24_02295 [Deltaproteobacteria bacterium RIFCSPLOWO2_02_FULL_53_8]
MLQEIKKNESNRLAGYAFQFALIEYSKPYRKTEGVSKKRNKLGSTHVPNNHIELHRRILDARDQIHAHSDLTVKGATLHVVNLHVANMEYEKSVIIAQNIIHGTEEFCNIDDIVDLIERTLDSMYIEVKRLEETLPLSSR